MKAMKGIRPNLENWAIIILKEFILILDLLSSSLGLSFGLILRKGKNVFYPKLDS